MLQLILLVVILVALAYMWNSTRPSGRSGGFFKDRSNPFKGRHTKPPPSSGKNTIDKGTMTRCHNCSCFFPETRVVRELVEGHILEFCSTECKRAFLKVAR
jgi:hypothetical protein